jgi:hypothetical protein
VSPASHKRALAFCDYLQAHWDEVPACRCMDTDARGFIARGHAESCPHGQALARLRTRFFNSF